MKLTMTRTFRGLEALDPAELRHIKPGDVVECEVVKPRSQARHRWFWAYITTVHANLSEDLTARWPRPENLVRALKLATGWYDEQWKLNGDVIQTPKSIAFHSMDETEFAAFCESCVDLANKYLIPGVDKEALRQEIEAEAKERRAA